MNREGFCIYARFTVGFLTSVTVLIASPQAIGHRQEAGKRMFEQIETATREIAEFEKTKEVNHLENAIKATQSVDMSKLAAPQQSEARQRTASEWFRILAVIDENMDPRFDETNPPDESITPPPAGAIEYPSSVDPKSIADPAARAAYEKQRKENGIKAEQFRLQLKLRRLDPRATANTDRLVIQYYTYSVKDQAALDGLLQESKLSPTRQLHIRGLFKHKDSRVE